MRHFHWQPFAMGATVTGAALSLFLGGALVGGDPDGEFREITVERINVVEPDGTTKLVISNRARQAEATIGGETLPIDRLRPPGLLFFNDVGDEVGGLVFEGHRREGGAGLMFDQAGQDQVLALGVQEFTGPDGDRRNQTGLQFWDRPVDITLLECIEARGEAQRLDDEAERAQTEARIDGRCRGVPRGEIGRADDGTIGFELRDASGRARLRLSVTEDGSAAIEFFDESGHVVRTLKERNGPT